MPLPPSVRPPTVSITGSPIDEGFHTGTLQIFTGRAVFNPAVDSFLNVVGMWAKTAPSSDLSADGRVTVGEVVMVGGDPMVFVSNLTINTINGGLDNGTYTLTLNISSTQPNTLGTTVSEERTIMVTSKSCDPHRVCAECDLPHRLPSSDCYGLPCDSRHTHSWGQLHSGVQYFP